MRKIKEMKIIDLKNLMLFFRFTLFFLIIFSSGVNHAGPASIQPILFVNLEPAAIAGVKSYTTESKITSYGFNISGSTEFDFALDTKNHHNHENLTFFKNRTIIKSTYNQFVLSGISDYLYFGNDDETDDYNFDIHEMYLRYTSPVWDIDIGKKIKRWGKTDQISPVDTLNPENMKDFIIPPYEDRKIPIWMADITFRGDNFFIEGVFIPFFEPSRFDYFGTDWAYFAHLRKNIHESPLPTSLKSYFESMHVNEMEPESGSDSFEYALRIGGTIDRLDYGFIYHYANEDSPNFKNFPIKNLTVDNPSSMQSLAFDIQHATLTNQYIETTYARTHIAGVEFETIISDFGIRGEAAVKENESYMTRSLTSVRSPSLFWVIGADYTSENQWYFNLQFAHQHIYDYDPSILFFESDSYSIIGEINKNIISDWLNASVQFTQMLSDSSWYLSPRIKYTYITGLEVMMGLNLFEGRDNSILGRYDNNDQIFIKMKYQF